MWPSLGQGTIKYLTAPPKPSEGIGNPNSRLANKGRKSQTADPKDSGNEQARSIAERES